MTAPTPAKICRHALVQWMAVCAVALVLSGCGGKEESVASQPPPAEPAQTGETPKNPPPADSAQTKPAPKDPPPADPAPADPPPVVSIPADPPPPDPAVPSPPTVSVAPKLTPAQAFALKKKSFEDHEYEPVIWGNSPTKGIVDAEYYVVGPDPDGLKKLAHTEEQCLRDPSRCWTRSTDNHLRLINASAAYARGATGKGEVVAVVDNGISHNSNEFDAIDENGNRTGSKVTVTTESRKVKQPWGVLTPPGGKPVPYDPFDPLFAPAAPAYFGYHPVLFNFDNPFDNYHHGTAVASVIAARRDGRVGYDGLTVHPGYSRNAQGVAFDASLYFHQVALSSNPLDMPDNLSDWTEEHDKKFAKLIFNPGLARKHGAFVVNHSFAWKIDTSDYGKDWNYTGGIYERDVRAKLHHHRIELEQSNGYFYKGFYFTTSAAETPDADKIIFVRGAGNSGKDDPKPRYPELHSRLPFYFHDLRKNVIAVVAVDQNGDLADFSNPCGAASGVKTSSSKRHYCLAAPGVNLHVALPVSQYKEDSQGKKIAVYHEGKKGYVWENNRRRVSGTALFTGTSAAAPVVTGALALMRQFFSVDHADGTRSYQLGNTELVDRLFATANKEGKYADSHKYGGGLIDLDAATRPKGALATSLSTDPNAQPFDASAFSLSGNAFGGAMRDALGDVKIAAFDELDAPFFFPLADGVSHAPQISAGHSDILHEHELSLGDAANASLALSLAAGELSAARIRRGNLWFSYGHHGGREAGLYFGDDGGNAPGNFGMNFFAMKMSAENPTNAARHFRAPLAFASPYLSLVRDGPGLGWSQPLRSGARFGFSLMHGAPQFDHFQNPGGARGLGALFDFRPNNTSLSLQAGAVREADGFLGARAQGNFGEISADTAFAGIGGDWAALHDWRLARLSLPRPHQSRHRRRHAARRR